VYGDGGLLEGITRGDGEIGERITSNVMRMRGAPSRIADRRRLSVRGEIILRLTDKETHFRDYASPRNAAAGTARRLDGFRNEHLTVVCYDLATHDEAGELSTEVAKLALLSELGFATPSTYRGGIDDVVAVHRAYSDGRRTELDYEIDGLVVKANQLEAQHLLGELNRRPRAAVAYKFASQAKVTRVEAVLWETGPSGRVTPVALVEPVELVGAVVRRASLHNMARVQELGLGPGDEVLISRRNDVIPYIEELVTEHRGERADPPESCAVCGARLTVEGEYLMCRNAGCAALVEGRIKNWIDAVGALEWGDKLIATLVRKELVTEPGDLYRLTVAEIAALDRHGEKSASNALEQLRLRLPLALDVFLAALGIEGFSTQTARLIVAAGYDRLEKVQAAGVEELASINGLGDIKARNIVDGLAARRDEIGRLCGAGLAPVSGEAAGPLTGKTFCITGAHTRPRKELVVLIEDHGGRVVSGVTKELSYLLIADVASTSSKANKARRYGTALISEDGLLEMIG